MQLFSEWMTKYEEIFGFGKKPVPLPDRAPQKVQPPFPLGSVVAHISIPGKGYGNAYPQDLAQTKIPGLGMGLPNDFDISHRGIKEKINKDGTKWVFAFKNYRDEFGRDGYTFFWTKVPVDTNTDYVVNQMKNLSVNSHGINNQLKINFKQETAPMKASLPQQNVQRPQTDMEIWRDQIRKQKGI